MFVIAVDTISIVCITQTHCQCPSICKKINIESLWQLDCTSVELLTGPCRNTCWEADKCRSYRSVCLSPPQLSSSPPYSLANGLEDE
ncbi:unnamed protein product [Nesidiocoris tenuis]|uniref:Uncharacterized protein n=1 Tax=Nesidiocoris tenuis TaxID=355587 RepID=A0A6H5HC16_9HEMI|nr:unnamed protein product [Nesidiocoris tenuis]